MNFYILSGVFLLFCGLNIYMCIGIVRSNYFCFLIALLILFSVPAQNFSKDNSGLKNKKILITKKQILPMPWQKLNGPFGGQGYTIRFSPDNPDKIIVTDSFAGIHISYDGGLTWAESVDGIDARTGRSGDVVPVFVTTIDPNNPNRIWCGVKNAMGVFLSEDGGMTWQRKDNGLPGGPEVEIRGLAVKPGDSNTVFCGGDLEEIAPLMGNFQRTQGIVYRTTDGGENWSLVLMGGNLFKDIIIDPKNPDTVYVASGIFDRQEIEKSEGIYKSTDGGNTWTQINNGIRNLYVGSLKFDPTNPDILWGTTGMLPQFPDDMTPNDGGIILSRDGGMTWTEVKRGRNERPDIYTAIGISPTNPDIVYAAAFGIFIRSTDGGMTWSETGFGPLGSNPGHPIDIAVDPNNDKVVLVDSYIGGVFKSTDAGETWTSNAFGYSGAETRGVAVSSDGKTVFATSRSGIFLSEDKGVNWLPVGLGDTVFDELQAIDIHPTDKSKILLGDSQNAKSSIFLSTDGGMLWKTVFMLFETEEYGGDPSSKGLDGEIAFTDIKWSKSNPNVAFASCVKKSLFHDDEDSIGWGLFKSTDGGKTWKSKQNGISGFKNTWSVDIDPRDEKVIYAATNDRGIIKSTDGGESWKEINNGLGDAVSFHSVAVSPLNSQLILAGSTNGQFFKSENGGESWRSVIDDFRTNDRVVSIVFNPDPSTHQVYAGCGATGFYVSNDDGNSWSPFNDGLSVRDIQELAVPQDASAVYAATYGGGIFRLPLKGDPLTLTRRQIETPSNAGLDGDNNRTGGVSPIPSSSSSSGEIAISEFSLNITGAAVEDGLPLFQKRSSKSQLLVQSDVLDSKVQITSDLPKAALLIRPNNFVLTSQNSTQTVTLVAPSLKKLNKIKKIQKLFPNGVPDKIVLHIKQIVQGKIFPAELEIQLIVQ